MRTVKTLKIVLTYPHWRVRIKLRFFENFEKINQHLVCSFSNFIFLHFNFFLVSLLLLRTFHLLFLFSFFHLSNQLFKVFQFFFFYYYFLFIRPSTFIFLGNLFSVSLFMLLLLFFFVLFFFCVLAFFSLLMFSFSP